MTDVPGDLLVPQGTRLLHIGPHKTGTTSVQGAFHLARRSAAAQNVIYAGPNRHPLQAAQGAATRTLKGRHLGSMRAWRALVREVDRATGRVVISSEWFADAGDGDIRLLVDDLDRTRLHVVVTLRPLTSILASQWQQFVQGGITTPYLEWLRTVFDEPGGGAGTRFWHRHRHDRLIDRWAAVVGPERITAVVVDDRDHAAVLRVFERLTGLAERTLALVPDRANRSLTQPEAELVRAMNGSFLNVGVDGALRLDLVLFGAANWLKLREPVADEPRIETPRWAIDWATDVGREIVEGIRRSGVRVVGDLDRLAAQRPQKARKRAPALATGKSGPWPEIVAGGALGTLVATGLARGGSPGPEVDAFSSQRLRSIFLGRLRGAAVDRIRALRAIRTLRATAP